MEWRELVSDPAFVFGIAAAMVFGLVLGLVRVVVGWLVKRWNAILQFFTPTKEPGPPPTKAGPSPFQRLMGCLGGILALALVASLIGLVLYMAVN